MDRVMQEAIRGFEMFYPELVDDVLEYREDRVGYLIVELRDGRILIYDDITTDIQDSSVLDSKKDFGRRLRLILNRKGISQKELAERSRVAESSICMYISGRRNPTYQTVCAFAEVLKCSTDDFRYDDPRKRK